MPVTLILLLIYISALVLGVIGATKKKKAVKVAAAVLFFIGITLTTLLVFALEKM